MAEATESARSSSADLRRELIERYVSSSSGIHRPCTPSERQAFVRAYRWHLCGWLPEDRTTAWHDLACGQGQLMSLAAELGFQKVYGVDLSAEMLSSCSEVGLCVERIDAAEYLNRLADESCGIISAFDFLEHLNRVEALALLKGARRVLQRGGIVLLKVPNGASTQVGDIYFSDLTHESMWTPSSIAQLATLAGFSSCDVREVGPVPHSLRSSIRYVLWQAIRCWYRLMNAVETGSPGSHVLTRVMLVRLSA